MSMPQVGFEPAISADDRSQTYALDHVATGTDRNEIWGTVKVEEVPLLEKLSTFLKKVLALRT